MKKKLLYFFAFIVFLFFIFLNLDSSRLTGINYTIKEEKISNFKKIYDFYERYNNYKNLVKQITFNKEKNSEIFEISSWVYFNINKSKKGDKIIDSHPWTIIERETGANDQVSDILSVLLVVNGVDAFFIPKINEIKNALTFFKYNNKWSVIDPFYGVYFLNKNEDFCSLEELRLRKCKIFHFENKNITKDKLNKIFYDKDFYDLSDLNNYYYYLFENCPTTNEIENTNMYLRGGRSYVQIPKHRLMYEIQKYFGLL